MYTEIVKIIEGGLSGNKEKVLNYSKVLADNLDKDGEPALAKRIRTMLSNKQARMTSLDSFSTKPVDIESRMDIVEITYPQINDDQLILSKYTEREINDFVMCYKKRDEILKLGAEVSNSLLLYGPPGCGKTTVAQYVSSITNLPLVTARLDGLISSLLGSTAKNIRRVFDYASQRECILFLDEFDVIAKLRDDQHELGELKRVVNSLIQNIDSLNKDNLLIAATNHHKLLDSAIWRRFSKVIILQKPDQYEIKRLLKLFLLNVPNTIVESVKKLDLIARALQDCSHSDIKTVINNCAKKSVVNNRNEVNSYDLFQEIYFLKNHNISDEDYFIKYLLLNGVTQKEINENFEYPLRAIQRLSKGGLRNGQRKAAN